MNSIMSFPERGQWGSAKYRGNCSGHIYKELFQQFKPRSFCDPMMGSGTSIDVAREMGIEAYGLDLRLGFNALRDSILGAIGGNAVDMVLSHPPYGDIIRYSGEVWGTEPHPDDLSWCRDDVDFHDKLQMVLLNQREATKPGGLYGTIIGDKRSRGQYVSYQAEAVARMPADELVAVLIKQQHNTLSDSRRYASNHYPRINHEFILIWERKQRNTYCLLKGIATTAAQRVRATWKAIVHMALLHLGGKAALADIYAYVEGAATAHCEQNQHFKAKVRQTLQLATDFFESEERGVWRLRSNGAHI